jgi:hypothetical protein
MTKVVNFEALQDEPPFILMIEGKEHPMKIASVSDFVENMKLIEKLGANSSVADEIEVSIKVISRAFPSLTEDAIRSWQVTTIDKLFRIARGEDIFATESGDESAEGNAKPAN